MLMIPGPAGYLEAALREPRRRPVPAAAVFCHPHPLHGGDMNNRVVYRAAKAAAHAGVAALRFNFRGVGASSGTHDDGRGEGEDVRAAIRWLGSRYPGKALALVGFSFGAWVGLRIGCEDPGIEALIGLGLPLSHYDFAFMSRSRKPALVVDRKSVV